MPVNKITSTEFAERISDGVNDRNDKIDTNIGPVKDVFIDPFSDVLENQNDRIVYLNRLISLKNASTLSPDDVDTVLANESIIRWDGSRAYTTLTFSRESAPTVDITVPVNFPVATIQDPATGNIVTFRTLETKTMYAASASAYYNIDTEVYELAVAASSITTGVVNQVGAYTITNFLRPISGFEYVTNKLPTNSSRGVETNEEAATRYFLHIQGSQISTPAGIKRFILDNISTVSDVYVVYGTDSYLTREETDAGAVDIWFRGETSATRSYVTYYKGTELLQSVDFQPIISVTSVSSVATGLTYTEGTDYEVVTGESEYSYSSFGSDGIRWIAGGSHPDLNDDVIITYTYNSLCNTLSAYFTQQEYYTMGADKLFRWSQPTNIAIEANLKVGSGSPSIVEALVREAVYSYVNSLALGVNLEEFDIDSEVSKIYGVDNWTYVNLQERSDTVIANSVADIEIAPTSYASLAQSDFIINLV